LIGYGNLLIIKHNDQYLTAYANNNALLAKEGDFVKKGQEIATVGFGASRKAMLHFEIRNQGKPVDPLKLLPKL
jgi:lipoprotein NlpD